MSIFSEIKEYISARKVAEGYGLKVSDKGMACCPFHDDRHPSMKIDSGFFCFACGAKGDAINYVAKLFSLSQIDAAKKIVQDFDLPVKIYGRSNKKPDVETIRRRKQKRRKEKIDLIKERFRRWRLEQINMLQEACSDIEKIRTHYMRAPPEALFESEEYAQAVKAESNIEYWLDILCLGTESEQQELFLANRKEIVDIVKTVTEAADRVLGRDRSDNG